MSKLDKEVWTLDKVLEELGAFGKYQVKVYSLILLTIITSAMYTSQYIFAAGKISYSLIKWNWSMSHKHNVISLDVILDELGHFGWYQARVYSRVLVAIALTAVHNGNYIFNAGAVRYRCAVPECEASPPVFATNDWGPWALPGDGRCERYRPLDATCQESSFASDSQSCSAWVYESNNTIVGEFNLACQDWKRTLVGTIHNVGVFASLAITAFVSDTFGRKTAFIMTAVMSGVMGVIRAFSVNYIMYIIMEFLEAAVGAGVYSSGYILALEMVGLNHRVLGGNIISITFALGQVLLAALAWSFPYWRTFTLVIYSPAFLFLLYIFFVEESVRWLLTKGRKKEAARIIFKAAAMNNKKLSPASVKLLSDDSKPTLREELESNTPKAPSVYRDVLRSRTLMTRVVICSVWWITLTFIYYGLSINSVSLAGNMYLNYILTSLVEIPGYLLSFMTLDRFGRKSSIMTAFFICGLALTSLPFIPSRLSWIQITLSMVGKLMISMAFSSIYIYTSELFPTAARHSLLGACSMIGRIGSLVAPQTPLLMAYMESLPYLIFGFMAVLSGLLMLLTPETLRTHLPDTIEQAENITALPSKPSRASVTEEAGPRPPRDTTT